MRVVVGIGWSGYTCIMSRPRVNPSGKNRLSCLIRGKKGYWVNFISSISTSTSTSTISIFIGVFVHVSAKQVRVNPIASHAWPGGETGHWVNFISSN